MSEELEFKRRSECCKKAYFEGLRAGLKMERDRLRKDISEAVSKAMEKALVVGYFESSTDSALAGTAIDKGDHGRETI